MDDNELAIGNTYLGSIITRLDVQERDVGEKFHRRSVFKLKNGIIMTENFYDEKAKKKYAGKVFSDAPFKPVPFMKQPKTKQSKKKKKETIKRKTVTDPMKITVYSSNDPNISQVSPDEVRGVWRAAPESGSASLPSTPLQPQDVLLYKPGEKPEEEDIVNLPSGVWCYSQGTGPSVEEEEWRPVDAVLYPPGATLPDNMNDFAIYTYDPNSLNQAWPPPPLEDNLKSELGKPLRGTTVPEKKCSKNRRDTKAEKPIRKESISAPLELTVFDVSDLDLPLGTPNQPRAIWYSSLDPIDDSRHSDVLPKRQEVLLYQPGEVPEANDPDLPGGVWCYNVGTMDDEEEDWKPYDAVLYPNGKKLPENVKADGFYTFNPRHWSPPSVGSRDVPPMVPRRFSSRDWDPIPGIAAPKRHRKEFFDPDEGTIHGVWENLEEQEDTEDNWMPLEVTVVRQEDLGDDTGIPHGVFAISTDAAPDDTGKWDPECFKFFPPGQIPSPGMRCKKIGYWKPPPGTSKVDWPPMKPGANPESPSDAPPRIPKRFSSKVWDPVPGIATPKRHSSASFYPDEGTISGVWENLEEQDDTEDNWMPLEVIVVRQEDLGDDTGTPHGVFAISNDAAPGDDGRWDPEYFMFFPPGQIPSPEMRCKKIGYWRTPPGKLDTGWPPVKSGGNPELRHSSRKVRKGEIPRSFEEEIWKSRPAEVYSVSSISTELINPDRGDIVKGVWESSDSLKYEDLEATEVILISEKGSDLGEDIPHGIFGISVDATSTENGEWDPRDFLFFPPEEEPVAGTCRKLGLWKSFNDSHRTWPRRKRLSQKDSPEYQGTRKREPGKLPKWGTTDNWIANDAKVFSRKNIPSSQSEDFTHACWRFPQSTDEPSDSDTWVSQDITLYQNGHEPVDLETNPFGFGLWGVNPKVSKKNVNGDNCRPRDVWVYPPGVEPDPGVIPLGKWGYPPGLANAIWRPLSSSYHSSRRSSYDNELNNSRSWPGDSAASSNDLPPRIPKRFRSRDWDPVGGIAFPKKDSPDSFNPDEEDISGVWEHLEEPEHSEDDWMPMKVVIVRHEDLGDDNDIPHGVFAISKDAAPDDAGNWDPEHFLFFPPGQIPSDNMGCKKLGYWKPPPGKLNVDWPPVRPEGKQKAVQVGKLRIPQIFQGKNWKPQPAKTISRSSTASLSSFNPDEGEPMVCVWGSSDSTMTDNFQQVEVILVPDTSPGIDEIVPHGIFGISSDASLAEDGNWQPRDFLLFAPKEVPRAGYCHKLGFWKPPPGKGRFTWPPTKVPSPNGRIVRKIDFPKRESHGSRQSLKEVGKLKIPETFSPNSTPKRGLQKRKVGKLKIPEFKF